MSQLTIDIFELARSCETLEGEVSLEDMPELRKTVLSLAGGAVRFVATGLGTLRQYPAVSLSIEGEAEMTCARCNQPVTVPFEHELTFILTKSEAEANRIPLDEDGDEEDVIVGSKSFDVHAWVQEETILTLPGIVSHDDCEAPAHEEASDDAPVNNPFAALAGLKKS